MDAILVGLFVNALWSFGEKLIYEIPRLRRDPKQAEFIQQTFNGIKDELKSIQDRFSDAALERIGRKFMERFQGNMEQLNLALSDFRENMPEIMESLGRLESGHERLERGQQEILEALAELRDRWAGVVVHPTPDREAFVAQVAEIYRITGHEVRRNVVVGGEKMDHKTRMTQIVQMYADSNIK